MSQSTDVRSFSEVIQFLKLRATEDMSKQFDNCIEIRGNIHNIPVQGEQGRDIVDCAVVLYLVC